jgi:hypothetical protein
MSAWQPDNKTIKECSNEISRTLNGIETIIRCGNATHEKDGICVACKVMAEVELKCTRLDVKELK